MKQLIALLTFLPSIALAQASELKLFCVNADGDHVYGITIEPEQEMGQLNGTARAKKTHFIAAVQDMNHVNNAPEILSTAKKQFSFKQTAINAFSFNSSKLKLSLSCEIERVSGPIGVFTGSN